MKRAAPFFLAALLLAASVVSGQDAEECIHDLLTYDIHEDTPIQEVKLTSAEKAVKLKPAVLGVYNASIPGAEGYKPIRIAVVTEDLEHADKHCTEVGQERPDFMGGTITCTKEDILTSSKRKTLVTSVVHKAIKLHADRLLVKPIAAGLSVPQFTAPGCSAFSVPADHQSGGVVGVDFYLYLAAAPMVEEQVAFGLTCAAQDGRPVAGVLNVSPRYIVSGRNTSRIVAHQLMHALGFNKQVFSRAKMISTEPSVRGKDHVAVVSSSNVLARAQEHYGCQTAPGMELEDQSSFTSIGLHWKRRNAKDELMSAISGADFYSAVTIAAMEDTGFYKGNYALAEHMNWGHKAGCSLLTGKCVEESVSRAPSMFCTDRKEDRMYCTSDRTAIGYCLIKDIGMVHDHFTYFPPHFVGSPLSRLMDYCPFVEPHSKMDCATGDFQQIPGSVRSFYGRCFESHDGLTVKGHSQPFHALCARVTCNDKSKTYEVQFRRAARSVACPEGATIRPQDHSSEFTSEGSVVCPSYYDVCIVGYRG